MIVDAELHADQEAEFLAEGSRHEDLWGINLYPDLPASDWLEFSLAQQLGNVGSEVSRALRWRTRNP